MGSEGEARIRLTKSVRQQLLDQNDGYTDQTYYRGENFREQRDYEIRDGQLHVRSRGKTSWADSRFDGQFITGVTSTGIYCRPSCPARTPAPRNMRFYPSAAAAHRDGFRACKRCRPDQAGSPLAGSFSATDS